MKDLYVWYMGGMACGSDHPFVFRAHFNPGSGKGLACNESVWLVPDLVNPYG